ncbi:MAG TPA: GIY-YIG nuclease family protein [Flavipsychrobacter sp.]|nr:GIY-YIG nuclease family protein [Flavipsychrobacter sp.]
MAFYVYIIQSLKDDSFYKGYSEHPYERLEQHNGDDSKYTSHKTPWKLVCLLVFETKRGAC